MIKLLSLIQEMQVNQPGNYDPTKPGSDTRLLSFIKANKVKILQHLSINYNLEEEADIVNFDEAIVQENNLVIDPFYDVEAETLQMYPGGAIYIIGTPGYIENCRGIYIGNLPHEVMGDVIGSGTHIRDLNLPGAKYLSFDFLWC